MTRLWVKSCVSLSSATLLTCESCLSFVFLPRPLALSPTPMPLGLFTLP